MRGMMDKGWTPGQCWTKSGCLRLCPVYDPHFPLQCTPHPQLRGSEKHVASSLRPPHALRLDASILIPPPVSQAVQPHRQSTIVVVHIVALPENAELFHGVVRRVETFVVNVTALKCMYSMFGIWSLHNMIKTKHSQDRT